VLAENLEMMEKENLLHQEVQNSKPIEVWYRLTRKGEDLSIVIKAMNTWGEKWLGRAVSTVSYGDGKPEKDFLQVAYGASSTD